jgi:hypothetical protein
MRMFTGLENCWRMELAERAVDAREKLRSRSSSATQSEGAMRVSQYAVQAPTIPAPMIATSAFI